MSPQDQEWRGADPNLAACSLPSSDSQGELEEGESPRAFLGGTRVRQHFETGRTSTELETGVVRQQNRKNPAQLSSNQFRSVLIMKF